MLRIFSASHLFTSGLLFTDLHLIARPPCSSTTICSSSCGPPASDHHSFAHFNHLLAAVLAHKPRLWRLPVMLHKAAINNHRSEHDLETHRDFDANSLFEVNLQRPDFSHDLLDCTFSRSVCLWIVRMRVLKHYFVVAPVLNRLLDLNQCWLSITLDDELRVTSQPDVVTNPVDNPSVSCTFCLTYMSRNTPSGLVLHDDL